MRGPRPIALAGIGAALLCNYWVLEGWLAERSDFAASWISDLATRTESTGWRFVTLGALSGLAIAAFALALLAAKPAPHDLFRPVGEKGHEEGWKGAGGWVRLGFWALFASGVFVVVASAAPLSCPEGIEPGCSLAYDPADVVHSLATAGEIAATFLAFALIGLGLLAQPPSACTLSPTGRQSAHGSALDGRALAWITLGLGAVWVLLTALTGVTYLGDGLDSVKGALQRADQILLGAWLILLGFAAPLRPAAPPDRTGA
ncbi:MAG: hypothetical protein U0R71_12365 [Solirubrobacterales bacterium]